MATVEPILRTAKARPDGHAPIWLRFCDARRTVYTSLRVYIHPRFWNERKGEVRKTYEHAEEINALIAQRLSAVEAERVRLLREQEPVTAEALRAVVAVTPAEAPAGDFLAYADRFLVGVEKTGNVARVDKERAVLAKLRGHLARVPSGAVLRRLPKAEQEAAKKKAAAVRLPFSSLTADLLRDFEGYLRGKLGNKASTVVANMTVLRIHARRAIKEGLILRDADPFYAYSLPRAERTERHRLSREELAALDGLDLGERGPNGSLHARVRDAFMLAVYFNGIRFADLAWLRMRSVTLADDGQAHRLAYTARKTGKRASTIVVPPAAAILAPYLRHPDGTPKQPDDFLLPILARYDLSTPRLRDKAVGSQNALHNKTLRALAERAGVRATVSMHVARHSFADLARRDGWHLHTMRDALGHSSASTTERYLAGFDQDTLDAQSAALWQSPDEKT